MLTQIILYDEADVRRWQALRQRGLVPAGAWSVLFVLGRYSAGQTSSAQDLLPFLAASDHALPWAVCAFGPEENACVDRGGLRRPHARGLREQPEAARRRHRAGQRRAGAAGGRRRARALGRPLANAADARRIYGTIA